MDLTSILITIFSLSLLIILHELGHFLLAKRFKMKVEEFGIGFPPRIYGRKIGETIYSINLVPLGGFVKIYGEDNPEATGEESFLSKPVYQRIMVVLGGVLVFWLVAFGLFTFLFATKGKIVPVQDDFEGKAFLQIVQVMKSYPAEKAGLKPLDKILEVKTFKEKKAISKLSEFKEIIQSQAQKEVILKIERGKEIKFIKVTPNEEGLIGVSLMRATLVQYSLPQAVIEGLKETLSKTKLVFLAIGNFFYRALKKEASLEEVRGPVGIGEFFVSVYDLGIWYFLYFLALISIYLAVFNILPIPALDGGRLMFLLIEAIRKKPLSPQLEAKIHGIFFIILVTLMLVVTIFDLKRIL